MIMIHLGDALILLFFLVQNLLSLTIFEYDLLLNFARQAQFIQDTYYNSCHTLRQNFTQFYCQEETLLYSAATSGHNRH